MIAIRASLLTIGLVTAVAGCAQLLGFGEPGDRAPDAGGITPDAMLIDAGSCEPLDSEDCYEGPPGTMGIGECDVGTRTCNAEGTGFGACDGDGAPAVERCGGLADAFDENCDGSPSCTGVHRDSVPLMAAGSQGGYLVELDAAGNIYVLGDYYNAFMIGADAMTPGEQGDVFFAKFTADGTPVYARSIAGLGWQRPLAMLVDPDGSLTVVGIYTTASGENFFIGDRRLRTAYVGSGCLFIAHYDPNGEPVWASTIEGAKTDVMESAQAHLARRPGGSLHVWLGVPYYQSSNFFYYPPDGPTYTQLEPGTQSQGDPAFVLELGDDGTLTSYWGMNNAAGGGIHAGGLVIDSSGSLLLAGKIDGTEIFVPPSSAYCAAETPFLLKLGPGPSYPASYCLPLAGVPLDMEIDALGNVYITGSTPAGASSATIFVEKKSSPGATLWTKVAGGTGTYVAQGSGIAVDAAGNVVVTGTCSGAIDFNPGGTGGEHIANAADICIAKYTTDGAWLWSKVIGDASAQQARDVAVDPLGNVIVTGVFGGTADFGAGALTANGSDVFLESLRP